MSNYYAIDFEADYDKDYGIEELGVYGYLHDPRFNPYLMSVWGEDIQWVGHPSEFKEWSTVFKSGGLLAHNSAFDRQVLERCEDLGIIKYYKMHGRPPWYCTANLSVFLGGPRSLKDAAKALLGVELSKEMRNYMKGKTWQQAVEAGKAEQLRQYALDDAKYCYEIWQKYNHLWPEEERLTAELTFEQTQRGVAVDTETLDKTIPLVLAARDEALSKIPWLGTKDSSGEEVKPLSSLAFKKWCKDEGIEVPSTTEAKSPEFKAWQERNPTVEVPKYMQTYRSANALALKAQTIRRQTRPDGRYQFNMLYYGASTGRWSGGYEDDRNDSGGVNLQNLIKEPLFGLDLRKTIIAPKGKKFVIGDFSQIEPRCLAWLSKDQKFLDALGKGVPLYEAHARAQGVWSGEKALKKTDPKLYLQKKAEVLALGYGAGWAKFIFMTKMYGAEECLIGDYTANEKNNFIKFATRANQTESLAQLKTEDDWMRAVNAWKIVTEFRRSKPQITGLWKQLENDCRKCHGTDYRIELPSGRVLPYFDVKTIGGLTARKSIDGPPFKVYGAWFTENVCQAFARDIARDAFLRLEANEIMTLWGVHDEIISEVDEDFDENVIKRLMCVVPEWCPGLPIEVEQEVALHYKK